MVSLYRNQFISLPYCVCVKCIMLCNCLCPSSPSSSHYFGSNILNSKKFEAKNYFTDHQTGKTIYIFRDAVLVLKIQDCYRDTKTFEQPSIPILQVIASYKVRAVCWCKKPISNSFETLQTVYTYPNCVINQLLYCWQCFSQHLWRNKQNSIDFMNGLYLQC